MMSHPGARPRTRGPTGTAARSRAAIRPPAPRRVLQPVAMTVRTWVTISVVVLVALGAAFLFRVLSPIRPPAILVTASDVRLDGTYRGSCWPQRGGDLRCEEPNREPPEGPGARIPLSGEIRVVVAFPSQPDETRLRFVDRRSGSLAFEAALEDTEARYRLDPGTYLIEVEARYGEEAFVRYAFPTRATSDRDA